LRQNDETPVLTVPHVDSLTDVVPETSLSHSDVDLCSDANPPEFIGDTYLVGYF